MQNQPSNEFIKSLNTCGSIVADCEHCGRTFFEDDETAGDWETGELEGLRKIACATPDRCIPLTHTVRQTVIGGKQAVIGCPCGVLFKYEEFIWEHRHLVAEYIAKRAKRIAEQALSDEGMSEFLKENVDGIDVKATYVACSVCGGFFNENLLDEEKRCPRCLIEAGKMIEKDDSTLVDIFGNPSEPEWNEPPF